MEALKSEVKTDKEFPALPKPRTVQVMVPTRAGEAIGGGSDGTETNILDICAKARR